MYLSATEVGRAGYPGAAVVAIAEDGSTVCTAKVAVHISYPITFGDAGRIVGGLLPPEEG